MKNVSIFFFLSALFILAGEARCETSSRGLFVAMLEEPTALSSRKEIAGLVDFAKRSGVKVLFVQVYRANLAWFPSRIADQSPYDKYLKKVSEDPLRLLIKEAHRSGLEVHAWLNMLSLGENKDARLLKKYGTGILTRNLKEKKRLEDYKIDDQYFLEPGDARVRQELKAMVGEMLRAYPDLDGILFDYLRYPDVNPDYGYSKSNVECFKRSTGLKAAGKTNKAWKDWKRAQVTECLKELARTTRHLRPSIRLSATGCMPYSRAYHEAFQDWPLWIKDGIVDSVTIMNYSPYPDEFESWISAAKDRIGDFRKVNIGVGAYKLADSPETFGKELRLCERSGAGGYVVFHYNSLLRSPGLGAFMSAAAESKK